MIHLAYACTQTLRRPGPQHQQDVEYYSGTISNRKESGKQATAIISRPIATIWHAEQLGRRGASLPISHMRLCLIPFSVTTKNSETKSTPGCLLYRNHFCSQYKVLKCFSKHVRDLAKVSLSPVSYTHLTLPTSVYV